METPSKELRRFLNCCNILPLTIGANIGVDQSKWIIVMQAAFFVTSLWACFNGIYGVSYIPLTNNFYDKQNIIPTIAVFAWVMGVFGTIILLMTRRKKIISMAGSLYEHISFGDKKSMIRRAIALPILALIFDTVLAISISLKDVKETHNNSKQTFVLQVTLLVAKSAADSLSSNFIVKGCVVYFIFYRLLSVYISHTLETIRTHLQSLRDRSTNLLVVHEILSESLGFMIEFDDMFSLLPFLWISNNFFYTTSTVYRMVKGNNKGFVIEQLVVDNLSVVLLVLYMSKQREKRERDKRIIQNLLVKQKDLDCYTKSCINLSLDAIACHEMTALGFFSLNRPILLSFVSTVLTLTVLFVQLMTS